MTDKKFLAWIHERLECIHGENPNVDWRALNQLKEGKGNIIGQVEKLKELGVKAQKAMPLSLKKDD